MRRAAELACIFIDGVVEGFRETARDPYNYVAIGLGLAVGMLAAAFLSGAI